MPASNLNFVPSKIKAGSIGYLWANVPAPAAGARATLLANAAGVMTPDSTIYTQAIHLGLTRTGAMAKIVPAFENYMADEFTAPVKTQMTALDGTIDAELLQVFDTGVMKIVTAGFGSFATGIGYDELSFGIGSQTYTGLLFLFPTEADPTKFCVVHFYKTYNAAGLDSIGGARKDMNGLKVSFKALDDTSRTANDTLGKMWYQTA